MKGLKDTVKAFYDFRNNQQKCMKQCFLIYKSMYILEVYSKATDFAPRRLIFKLQQEVLKFHNICVSWSPRDKFFKPRLSKFWERLNSNF